MCFDLLSLVKMQQSEVTLGRVGVVVGWATVYYSEGLLCHGLGQVQPSSAKFTSATSLRFGLAMTDTERRNPRKKTRRKTSKIGWAAGSCQWLHEYFWKIGYKGTRSFTSLFSKLLQLCPGLMPLVRGLDKTTKVTSFFSSSSCMPHVMMSRCIIQKFASFMPWSWSVLADRMWEYFLCCRWLKIRRVVLSKCRFQEKHMQLDRIPSHSTRTVSTLQTAIDYRDYCIFKAAKLCHWAIGFFGIGNLAWQFVFCPICLLRGWRHSHFWAPVILCWDHLWLSMHCIKATNEPNVHSKSDLLHQIFSWAVEWWNVPFAQI